MAVSKTVEQKVKELVSFQLEVRIEMLTKETNFIDDLGMDSLDGVELVMALEEEFDLIIDDRYAETFHTIGDVVKHIEEQLNAQSQAA